ncbi:hypothetical protein HYX00_01550 [Candidatus Woesearchaeota archaeon]|nr:hypothetical protein [Candidatus Woesearchaeota archaeon]
MGLEHKFTKGEPDAHTAGLTAAGATIGYLVGGGPGLVLGGVAGLIYDRAFAKSYYK